MSDTRDRPVPLSRVWSRNKIIAENLDGDDLGDVLELHSGATAWWIVPREGDLESRVRTLAHELELDRGAVEDLLATDRRAKYDQVGGSTQLLIVSSVMINKEAVSITIQPMSMVITDRALICLAEPGHHATDLARTLSVAADRLGVGGLAAATRVIARVAVQSQSEAIEWLEGTIEDLSTSLFEGNPLTQREQLRAFRLRRAITELVRLTQPTLDVVSDLAQNAEETDPTAARQWTLLSERQGRVVRGAEAARESLLSGFDTNLALSSQRMNSDVKRLTGWAAIVAVPTLITGFVGMNVSFPFEGSELGFWFYLALMVITGIVLFVIFRRHDWI